MPAIAELTESAVPPLRIVLRQATQGVHERMHGHDGFASIQDRSIQPAAYRHLLMRLYGFYVPFEVAAGGGRDRTNWLEDDLATLGLDHRTTAIAMCPRIPALDSPGCRLGARYVVEGSALGGRGLARGLDPLLGAGVARGRSFFNGRGAGTAEAWTAYLAQLAAAPAGQASRATIIRAAMGTFVVFGEWLAGWKDPTHG
ncbi:MAG: biliverdin-producing heme oxygenase [Rubritepida sp.]|nr:biliverdin-producing heme oxygenase [Rubritepida sp.]